jgi:hypothetical protein
MAKAILIILSVIFSFGLLYIGLPLGIPVIIIIDIIVLFLTGEKEKRISVIKNAGKWGQDRLEIIGTSLEEGSKLMGKMAVKGGRVVAAGIEEAYKEMGGREGAQKAVKKLSDAAAEVGKIGTAVIIEAGNVIEDVAKDAQRQIQENKKNREQEKYLEAAAEFVDFVVMDDD